MMRLGGRADRRGPALAPHLDRLCLLQVEVVVSWRLTLVGSVVLAIGTHRLQWDVVRLFKRVVRGGRRVDRLRVIRTV